MKMMGTRQLYGIDVLQNVTNNIMKHQGRRCSQNHEFVQLYNKACMDCLVYTCFSFLICTQNAENKMQNNRYRHAQIKLLLTFFSFGVGTLIVYSSSIAIHRKEGAYSQALEQYLSCEEMGASNNTCDRSIFEEHDPTPIIYTLNTITFAFIPLATLVYVTNTKKLLNYCQTKIKGSSKDQQCNTSRKTLTSYRT